MNLMRKFAVLIALAVAAVAVPAQAAKPPKPHRCVPETIGFKSVGSLTSATLTQQAEGRYDGTLEVNVTRANHHAGTGDQTYALTDSKVRFHHGVDPTAPAIGSRAKTQGKVTRLPGHCDQTNFTPTLTVKRVDIKQPKA
jgi:hypothetical protein